MKPNQISDPVLKHIVNLLLEKIPSTELYDSKSNEAYLKIDGNDISIKVVTDESGHVSTLWITDKKMILATNDYEALIRVKYEDVESDIDLHRALSLARVNYNNKYAYNYRFIEFRTERIQRIVDEIIIHLNKTMLNYSFRYIEELNPIFVMNFLLHRDIKDEQFNINVDLTDNLIKLTATTNGETSELLTGIIKNHVRSIETYLNNHKF